MPARPTPTPSRRFEDIFHLKPDDTGGRPEHSPQVDRAGNAAAAPLGCAEPHNADDMRPSADRLHAVRENAHIRHDDVIRIGEGDMLAGGGLDRGIPADELERWIVESQQGKPRPRCSAMVPHLTWQKLQLCSILKGRSPTKDHAMN
jgi:hypothetical protein